MTSDTRTTRSGPASSGRPARAGSSPGRASKNEPQLLSDAEIDSANEQLALAFSLLGLYDGSNPVCPNCGNAKKKTVVFKTSKSSGKPYWKCYPCGENGSATKLLQEKGGMGFREAVARLLGREVNGKVEKVVVPEVVIEPPFVAVVDVEVYDTIRDAGSVGGAQAYWAQWHIDPEVSATAGSTMLTLDDPEVYNHLVNAPLSSREFKGAWERHVTHVKGLHREWTKRFTKERLVAAGVLSEKGYFLVNEDYCVIEPHETPTGHVVGMQFRPVGSAKAKVEAHKAWKRQWAPIARELWPDDGKKGPSDAWEHVRNEDAARAGEKHEYVTPFLSLRGAGPDSLVGCGLRALRTLPEGSAVYVVEGFKDMLAARTLGAAAYAIPGTGNMPPEKVCGTVLSRLDVVVALDGDAAGEKGRKALIEHFASTWKFVVRVTLRDADQAGRGANVLSDNATLTALMPGGFALRAEGAELALGSGGLLAEGKTLDDVLAAYAKLVGKKVSDLTVTTQGVQARLKPPMRPGMDVADVLVEKVAHTGCKCPTCVAWRAGHPADPHTCPCATCTRWRASRKGTGAPQQG